MGDKLIKNKKETSSVADYEWDDETIRKGKNGFVNIWNSVSIDSDCLADVLFYIFE